ncbi:MAG: glycoside hydrolase family 88 protein [Butyrivibrio sp.]|nr:glycoside hydrolase family 88 protein [Butyrivibrio sp.]
MFIEKALYEKMINSAITQLHEIQNPDLKSNLKSLAKKALGKNVSDKDIMFWPAGMLLLGMSESCIKHLPEINSSVSELVFSEFFSHIDLWNNKFSGQIAFPDDSLSFTALIHYLKYIKESNNAEKTDNPDYSIKSVMNYIPKYEKAIACNMEFLEKTPKASDGSIIYNPKAGNDYVFADGAGMTAMFLSSCYLYQGNDDVLKLAETQLLNFKEYGLDERTGLPYHGYSIKESLKKGIIGWGRAVGWLMMGLSEYIYCTGLKKDNESSTISNTNSDLITWFESLMQTVLSYQRPDGGFSWQLECVEGHLDTSATGMICYSINKYLESLNNEFENNSSKPDAVALKASVKKAQNCILSNISEDGFVQMCLSGCEDFAVHYQTYGQYPWGQGAALLAL